MEAEICALAPSDWKIRSVEDVCKRVTSGGTPSRARPDFYVDGSWPWVKTQELQDTWIEHTEEKITEEAAANSSAKVLPANSILLAMYGATVGQLGILRIPMSCNQACCAMIVDSDKADFRYLYYHLRLSRPQLKSLATGAAQQNLSGALIKSLRYPFPPLAEQKAIAAVLGALDDKIELNRRMNATLEAMARALFQSWFVDFDPVRAKMDGYKVAMLREAATDLFPAHLEDSPVGEVPAGWSVLKFADVLTSRISRIGEDIVPEFSATVAGLSSRDKRFKKQLSKSQSKNKRIVEGDLVFGLSREVINFGLMREPVGSVSPVYEVFKIDSSKIESEMLERLFRSKMPYYMDILKPGAREGKPIDRDYLLQRPLLVPGIAVQRAFLAKIQPWTDKFEANQSESHTLANLRDTLLPELLSGKLRIN
jgi:hypothetical protein